MFTFDDKFQHLVPFWVLTFCQTCLAYLLFAGVGIKDSDLQVWLDLMQKIQISISFLHVVLSVVIFVSLDFLVFLKRLDVVRANWYILASYHMNY